MSNIKTQLNLKNLVHVVKKIKSKSGNEIDCIVIPIEANHIYVGEKGFYLNLIGFELKNKSETQTHMVKQSFSKEFLESLTDEEKKELPILGNHLLEVYFKKPEMSNIERSFQEEEIQHITNDFLDETDLPF